MGAICTWCGNEVPQGEGYRLTEPAGSRVARFCRLEHVVPWAIQGAHWEPESAEGGAGDLALAASNGAQAPCALCGEAVGSARVELVHHRAEHRIADRFCSVAHLLDWAKEGGRWRA